MRDHDRFHLESDICITSKTETHTCVEGIPKTMCAEPICIDIKTKINDSEINNKQNTRYNMKTMMIRQAEQRLGSKV